MLLLYLLFAVFFRKTLPSLPFRMQHPKVTASAFFLSKQRVLFCLQSFCRTCHSVALRYFVQNELGVNVSKFSGFVCFWRGVLWGRNFFVVVYVVWAAFKLHFSIDIMSEEPLP